MNPLRPVSYNSLAARFGNDPKKPQQPEPKPPAIGNGNSGVGSTIVRPPKRPYIMR